MGAISGTEVTPAPSVRSIIPPASAISALISVSSIAATDPNTSVRTITATAIPISSPMGASCCSATSTTGPRIATSSPSPSATRAASSSCRASCCSTSNAGRSYWTVAKATLPSSETWPLPRASGSLTEVTWGSSAISRLASAIACARSPSRTVPSSAWKTTVAPSFAAAGKRSSSRSSACWDSAPGTENSSVNCPPTVPASAPRATMTTAAIASERRQFREALRAIRSRSIVMAGHNNTLSANLRKTA